MSQPISIEKLKNLGAKSSLALKSVGIQTVKDLEEVGVAEAYCRVEEAGFKPGLNLLWSMAAGLMDMNFAALPTEVKEILKKQLDDLHRQRRGAQLPLNIQS